LISATGQIISLFSTIGLVIFIAIGRRVRATYFLKFHMNSAAIRKIAKNIFSFPIFT
jgi:hypothetical protein